MLKIALLFGFVVRCEFLCLRCAQQGVYHGGSVVEQSSCFVLVGVFLLHTPVSRSLMKELQRLAGPGM
jgi:hypothetical protein